MLVYNAQDQLLRHSEYFTEYTYEDRGTWGLILREVLGVPFSTFYRLKTARPANQSELVTSYYYQDGTTATARLLKETFYESDFHSFPTRVIEAEVASGDKLSNVQRGGILNETRRTYVNDLVSPIVATDNACGNLAPGTAIVSEQN